MEPPPSGYPALSQALAEAHSVARDQLSAAWELQLDNLEQLLRAGWKDQLARVFDERFAELGQRLESEFRRRLREGLEEQSERAREELRRQVSEQLAQAVRRLHQAPAAAQWNEALLDGAAGFCRRAALFTVTGHWLKCEGARGFEETGGEPPLAGREVPLAYAPAFAGAVESRETVAALRSAGEISEALAALVGDSPETRVYLFPVVAKEKCVAVLYAEPRGETPEAAALELLTVTAAMALEARAAGQARLITTAGAGQVAPPAATWESLPAAEREIHLRAQRFARVQVAEMRLYKADRVKSGRAGRNLYETLKEEIEAARDVFCRQFVAGCPSMVDYLHLELVRTLANDDIALLGPTYPGPVA